MVKSGLQQRAVVAPAVSFVSLHAIDSGFRAFAEVLHPGGPDAWVVLGRLDEIDEPGIVAENRRRSSSSRLWPSSSNRRRSSGARAGTRAAVSQGRPGMRRALGESFANSSRWPIASVASWLATDEPDGLRNGRALMPDTGEAVRPVVVAGGSETRCA